MGATTKIDWCDSSWNPVTGCYHECPYCYARDMARRFGGHLNSDDGKAQQWIHELEKPMHRTEDMGDGIERIGAIMPYPYDFEPTFHRYALKKIRQWKKPRTIFVCSMADLFGDWVPDSWIHEVFKACEEAPRHRYIFLTKNPKRLIEYAERHPCEININGNNWLFGTTVNVTADMSGRGLDLANFGNYSQSSDKFLSIEPIQEEFTGIALRNLSCFDWIIVGAETGNRKGRVKPPREWIDAIAAECEKNGVPIFMKESLREIMGDGFKQELPWPTLEAHSCFYCKWLTDEFTSICWNDESERCADFVDFTDTCEHWEEQKGPRKDIE